MLNYLRNVINPFAGLGVVYHIGAGKAAELTVYQQCGAQKVVLVEANQSVAFQLEKATKDAQHIEVVNALVHPFDGTVSFNRCNSMGFSSVFELDQITQTLPNLTVQQVVELPCTHFAQILDNAKPCDRGNLLVLEVMGAEANWLTGFAPCLANIDYIAIKVSLNENYVGGASVSEVCQVAQELGFELTYSDLKQEAFGELFFARNSVKASLSTAQAQLQSAEQQLQDKDHALSTQTAAVKELEQAKAAAMALAEEQRSELQALTAQQEQLTGQLKQQEEISQKATAELSSAQAQLKSVQQQLLEKDRELGALTASIKEMEEAKVAAMALAEERSHEIQALVAQQEQLTEQHQVRLEQQAEISQKATAELSSAQTQLKSVQQQLLEKDRELGALTASIKEMEEAKVAALSLAAEQKTEIQAIISQRDEEHKGHMENKQWAESLQNQVRRLTEEAGARQRSADLTQKMHAKAQIDLDHLRESYAAKVKSEGELVELVSELREKLIIASKYYLKMQQEHPELLTQNEHAARG